MRSWSKSGKPRAPNMGSWNSLRSVKEQELDRVYSELYDRSTVEYILLLGLHQNSSVHNLVILQMRLLDTGESKT